MASAGVEGGRREQIDGLRVIAMTGVLYVHLWNQRPALESVRVSLFFIISGFLIGVILLSAKASGKKVNVINFYIRRFLRLLPALFLMLFFAALFNMDDIRDSLPWHVLQVSSVYFAVTEGWKPWIVSHLWSLNIVEQFYVVCPLVVIFMSRRQMFVTFCFIFVASIVLRTNYSAFGMTAWSRVVFSFDPVAAGVILAMLKDNRDVQEILASRLNTLAAAAIIASPFAIGSEFGHSETYRILSIYALASIVMGAYVGYSGVAAALLANPVTRFLSRVSYATYVYHLAIWWLIAQQWPELYQRGPLTFLVVSAATLCVATASWHLIERHFDAQKTSFPVIAPPSLSPERA